MKPRFVLDAWAVLALLQREEPAASRVRQLLKEAERDDLELFMSIINLGEVIYRVGKVKGEQEAMETADTIRRLSLTITQATEQAVFAAARFKMRYAISYADAFAAAGRLRDSPTRPQATEMRCLYPIVRPGPALSAPRSCIPCRALSFPACASRRTAFSEASGTP